jgi:hypothetical protein
MSVDDLPTKEEILKKHITGYRGAVKQSDALKAMEEYAKQEARKAFEKGYYHHKCIGSIEDSDFEKWWEEQK